MLFGTPQRLAKTDKMLKVSYRQQLINFVEEYKYLGNIVDKNLTFKGERTSKKNFELFTSNLCIYNHVQKLLRKL